MAYCPIPSCLVFSSCLCLFQRTLTISSYTSGVLVGGMGNCGPGGSGVPVRLAPAAHSFRQARVRHRAPRVQPPGHHAQRRFSAPHARGDSSQGGACLGCLHVTKRKRISNFMAPTSKNISNFMNRKRKRILYFMIQNESEFQIS